MEFYDILLNNHLVFSRWNVLGLVHICQGNSVVFRKYATIVSKKTNKIGMLDMKL